MPRPTRSRIAKLEREARLRSDGTVEELIRALDAVDRAESVGAPPEEIARLEAEVGRVCDALREAVRGGLEDLAREDGLL